jgi:hypothetical protein
VKKTTLAVPASSSRVGAFLVEARVSGRTTATLSVAGSDATETAETSGTADSVPWNPLSFASARAALVEAETLLGGSIDELLVIADPPADTLGIAGLTPKAIEGAVLEWAAGHAELLREAVKRFSERGGGAIILVIVHANRGPLGAMSAGALIGLAEGILSTGSGDVRFMALRDESDQPDMLARQLVNMLDEPPRESGRIQRFGGRTGIFGRT